MGGDEGGGGVGETEIVFQSNEVSSCQGQVCSIMWTSSQVFGESH